MLFSMSKGPKLKEKHPSLTLQETAVRLGKRWQTMGAQRQEKYRQQSALLRKNYSDQMQEFYQEHPDARPPPAETIKLVYVCMYAHTLCTYVCMYIRT